MKKLHGLAAGSARILKTLHKLSQTHISTILTKTFLLVPAHRDSLEIRGIC